MRLSSSLPPWLLFSLIAVAAASIAEERSLEDFLSLGDEALLSDDFEKAIDLYQGGIRVLLQQDDNQLLQRHNSLSTVIISLHTNLGTAYSAQGQNEPAAESYQNALLAYKKAATSNKSVADRNNMHEEATLIAAQASFFLGMVYQDLHQPRDSVDAYTYANLLDPLHWASLANLGAVFHDDLGNHREALSAYNKAYSFLVDTSHEVTDPPPEPRFILSQLQYRIGLCLSHDLSQNKCIVMQDDGNDANQQQPADCEELATHAFSLAVEYDPENESAKHMLATITADATMNRASNVYIKGLFDDYAKNFEHSLVKELRYTGFERLRRGFDRALSGGKEAVPIVFDLVVDAGCGTGLVGEQFRNISRTMIGVDLSEAILEQAVQTRPGLYDEILVGDVTQVFRDRKPISLIIAGDSYIYFGDLQPLFESMQDGLTDDGYAAFTLENVSKENEDALTESKPDWRWQLTASGRFAHRKEYVVDVAKTNGLDLVHYESIGTSSHFCRVESIAAVGKHV